MLFIHFWRDIFVKYNHGTLYINLQLIEQPIRAAIFCIRSVITDAIPYSNRWQSTFTVSE